MEGGLGGNAGEQVREGLGRDDAGVAEVLEFGFDCAWRESMLACVTWKWYRLHAGERYAHIAAFLAVDMAANGDLRMLRLICACCISSSGAILLDGSFVFSTCSVRCKSPKSGGRESRE